MPTTNEGISFHSKIASRWEVKYENSRFASRSRCVTNVLGKISRPGQYWLDAGCGTGYFSRVLATSGCSVLGVDASPPMLNVAEKIATQSSLRDRIEYKTIETIEKLSLSSSSFDGVVCSSVLEYVNAVDDCLRELSRVLRPGGFLAVSVPNSHSLIRNMQKLMFRLSKQILERPWPEYLAFSKHDFSDSDFRTLLRQHSLLATGVHYFGFPLPGGIGYFRGIAPLILLVAQKK